MINIHNYIQIARVRESVISNVTSRKKSVVLVVINERCARSCSQRSGRCCCWSVRVNFSDILRPEVKSILVRSLSARLQGLRQFRGKPSSTR
jgi:hypothetical protein